MFTLPKIKRVRPPDTLPDRRASNWLLASSFLVMSLHSLRLPLTLLLIAMVLLAWRFLIDNRGWLSPGLVVRLAITVLMLVTVLLHYGTLIGRDAGTALLVVLLALKLMEMRTRREYLFTVFLQFFLILVLFLHSQSIPTGAAALILGFVTTITLIQVSQGVSQSKSFKLGSLAKMAGGIFLKALPLMLIFYLLFPRIQGSLWGLPTDAFGRGSTGLSDKVSPGSISQLVEDDSPAFRAYFSRQRPDSSDLYWRSIVLSNTDGRTWNRALSQPDISRPIYQALDTPVHYVIEYEAPRNQWLSALDLPAVVPPLTRLGDGLTIVARPQSHGRHRFEMSSHLRYNTGEISDFARRRNLSVPRGVSSRVRELVTQWQQQTSQPDELVQIAWDFFGQDPFRYTLQPPLLGNQPIDEFLFETRAGYCEHYASAFAMLMRIAGIPSRLVVGYQGGEWNEAGGYLLVRKSDAHAWTEVWLKDRGWVRVDPTAAIAPERVELGNSVIRQLYDANLPIGSLSRLEILKLTSPSWLQFHWRNMRHIADAVSVSWENWVVAYGPEAQRAFAESLGLKGRDWTQQIIVMFAATALFVFLISLFALKPRRNEDQIADLYNRFCEKINKTGITRQSWEGPQDFAKRVVKLRPELAEAVEEITDTYIQLRFGGGQQTGLGAFREKVKELKIS